MGILTTGKEKIELLFKTSTGYVKRLLSSDYVVMNNGKTLEESFTELNGNIEDTGWVDCKMGNGISPYDAEKKPQVRRIGKTVYLRGTVKNSTTWETHDNFLTIPSGFRPPYKYVYVMQGSGSNRYTINIFEDGRILADRYSNNTTMNNKVSLNAWLNVYCSWLID